MGNRARYWFLGRMEVPLELIKALEEMGLRDYNGPPTEDDGMVYEIEEKRDTIILIHIFVDATNYHWKLNLESLLKKYNVPFQKWMEG